MNTDKPSPAPGEAPKGDETTELTRQEPVQNALWQWTELVKLEHRRIDSNDQRTQMLRHMIDVQDAADQRQAKFYTDKLHREDENKKQRDQTARRIVWTLIGIGTIFLSIPVWMLFAGNDTQREMAEWMLDKITTLIGGAGLVYIGQNLLQKWIGTSNGS